MHGLPNENSPAKLRRHPPRRFDLHLRELRADPLFQVRTGGHLIGRYPFSLCLTTSNNTIPAATLTFSELIFPRIGIETIASHFSLTSRRTPLPSLPNTIASGTFMSKSVWRFPVPPSTPTTHNPRSFNSSISGTRLVTRATRTYSTAPAEVLATVSLRPAARCSGMKTPSTPAHSQVRRTAPRLCGSSTPSSSTTRGGSPIESRIVSASTYAFFRSGDARRATTP